MRCFVTGRAEIGFTAKILLEEEIRLAVAHLEAKN
jgi:hypothetical protein